MEDKLVALESAPTIEDHDAALTSHPHVDHGWQKVTYAKRQRKTNKPSNDLLSTKIASNGTVPGADNVFRSLEQKSEERRRRIAEAKAAAIDADEAVPVRSKIRSDDEEGEDSDGEGVENGKPNEEAKKVKPKKPKKPKISVAEAAAKIDVNDLLAFLTDVSGSYETQQDIQLMRFADYFGRAFSGVSASQFPWVKMLRESPVAKIVDIPLSHISEDVYKASVDWLNKRSLEALSSFVLWSLDSILADFASQQASTKGSKKGVQHASSKSQQVAIFVVLAMVLRRKPDILIHVLPTIRENSKYQGQDKLPVLVWMIVQACQADLAIGLYAWAHNLLPIVSGKSCNPQSRDLILQLVERILSYPKARTILINGAVRKGERLIPPSSFEILLRVTFPASSARVKATERFEAIYPTLKEVALAGSPGSKAMKQVSQQIFSFAAKAAGESVSELSGEATNIFIWCLTKNADCYKQWDKIYQDNLEASVSVLKKLSDDWKKYSLQLAPFDALRETLKSFRIKNEKALANEEEDGRHSIYKEADKYTKAILNRVSRSHGCLKSMAFIVIALGIGAAVMSPNIESLDWEKLTAFIPQHSF
ncbi:DUF2359 domain-containing protein [Cucumis melo var. makuwa]|uniref:DUF2359 domain-containing protein n=1 Tax=Cucumis melo var. makuwa TaxID=1194695 RepID=A0A5A7TCK6_CUCMM|nr:DUF2359 domain-containing protein [Cucumis melo var. makuwa]